MKPSEIIVADAINRGVNQEVVLRSVLKMLKDKTAIMLQKNNSVLILENIGNKSAALYLFTQDQPMTLVKSVKSFIDTIKKSDLQAVYGRADNPQIIGLLQSLGVPVQQSDNPKYNWMAMV
jgi:hypothetical protein